MGLRVIAREPDKVLVVFPDEGTLDELRRRIQTYSTHDRAHYANIAGIEAIEARKPADKIGSRLKLVPLEVGETDLLDVALWHSGDSNECRRWVDAITVVAEKSKHRVTDWWIGNDICLLRMEVDQRLLETLLEIDFVRSVDRRAKPSFEFRAVTRVLQSDIDIVSSQVALRELAGIVVVDSGVMTGHPALAPAIGDAQSFVSGDDRSEDVDETTGGHGTAVAGIAAYGDIGAHIESRRFEPTAAVFSGRILTESLEYDPEQLLEHQLEALVNYFVDNYPNIKIVNLSIGNLNNVFDGSHQSTLAAAIDELAYRFRHHQLLFVVATGNYEDPSGEEAITGYPRYLLCDDARLIEPATSALAITVGGVAYGPGTDPQELRRKGTEQLVAQNRGWPSPFTRSGLGVNDSVKPDVVDFAGDIRFERGRTTYRPAQHAGLPSTSKDFAPPDGQLFRTVAGTSYSAPRVANLAARLYEDFPSASANLIRALIAASAEIPTDLPPAFVGSNQYENLLRIYGYGLPDYERARFSAENEVLLLAEGELELDSFQVFELPAFPAEFLRTDGDREIAVTLAFDPPSRQTRADSYLGVRMYAHLFRNLSPGDLVNRLSAMTPEELAEVGEGNTSLSDLLSSQRVTLTPGVNTRRKGTLQKGTASIRRSNWQYDGSELFLAVVCQRMWAPADIERQRFAAIVSLAHSDDSVLLHTHIRQRAQIWQRARIRV
ncbi:MAG: S8 family peptidase [Chloroflexota bacterium]|nr:S8 family peptidase [Chloroflexota bacterium]